MYCTQSVNTYIQTLTLNCVYTHSCIVHMHAVHLHTQCYDELVQFYNHIKNIGNLATVWSDVLSSKIVLVLFRVTNTEISVVAMYLDLL